MMTGSCHCGGVRIELPSAPQWAASCNCSTCRKTGSLVAYYRPGEVQIKGETATYITGDRFIRFHHCPTCACKTHWSANDEALAGDLPEEVRAALAERMGVNVRLLDSFAVDEGRALLDGRELEIRYFDNADA